MLKLYDGKHCKKKAIASIPKIPKYNFFYIQYIVYIPCIHCMYIHRYIPIMSNN